MKKSLQLDFYLGKLGWHYSLGHFTSSPFASFEMAEEAFKAWARPSNPEYKKALEEAQK